MEWTVEFETDTSVRFKGTSFLKNVSTLCSVCFFSFRPKKCLIWIKSEDTYDVENRSLLKQIVLAEADIIADILSWEYEIPLRNPKIYSGNPKKIKIPLLEEATDANFVYQGMFTGNFTTENLDIISGYRQMKDEKSRPLRYLMCYRLLEIFSKSYGVKVDELIRTRKIKTKFIRNSRNSKYTESLITHFRNKIHPTKKTYKFPSSVLSAYLGEIENVVTAIIQDIITVIE